MDKIGTRNKISDFLGSNSDRKRMSSMKLPDHFWPEIHNFRSNFGPKYVKNMRGLPEPLILHRDS
jgi:hypothetical protein